MPPHTLLGSPSRNAWVEVFVGLIRRNQVMDMDGGSLVYFRAKA